ncbi:MAG: DUF6088 family protein, partial [Gammaproteobacteria bacterium]
RAVSRCVNAQRIKRVSKGRFYTPKPGVLGPMSVSDSELLRDVLFRRGKRRAYITGPALYNRLGLTTQIPKTVMVATNGAAQTKDFGTIRIKYTPRRAPISESTVPLLELLDVLRDAKKVPGAKADNVVEFVTRRIGALNPSELKKLQKIAVEYYSASTRALLGMILERIGEAVLLDLRRSINPTTRFELSLNLTEWPEAGAWNIR